jgi:hypothetical protein
LDGGATITCRQHLFNIAARAIALLKTTRRYNRIARIWDLQRLGADFPLAWLEGPADPVDSLMLEAEESEDPAAFASADSLE